MNTTPPLRSSSPTFGTPPLGPKEPTSPTETSALDSTIKVGDGLSDLTSLGIHFQRQATEGHQSMTPPRDTDSKQDETSLLRALGAMPATGDDLSWTHNPASTKGPESPPSRLAQPRTGVWIGKASLRDKIGSTLRGETVIGYMMKQSLAKSPIGDSSEGSTSPHSKGDMILKDKKGSESDTSKLSLEDVLTGSHRTGFADFCQRTMCSESLNFLAEVAAFKRLAQSPTSTPESIAAKAKSIADEFITVASSQEVNVSAELRNKFAKALESDPTASQAGFMKILDDLDAEIRDVVASDHLDRYKRALAK